MLSLPQASQNFAPAERLALVLDAVLKGQERVLSKLLKLTKTDASTRHANLEYVRAVASAGCATLVTSCDDLELAAGMRVRLRPDDEGKEATGVLLKPVRTGTGLTKSLAGWVVKFETAGTDGKNVAESKEVPLEEIPSQRGVKIWARLPLHEFRALKSHHSGANKKAGKGRGEQQKEVHEPAGGGRMPTTASDDLAIKRLLDYKIGDIFILGGVGYTTGWRMAERVPRQVVSTDEGARFGNVQEKDLEALPLAPETTQRWCATHAIEFLHDVKALALVGDDAMFLAAASASILHIFIRAQLGSLGVGGIKGLLEAHSRTRDLAVSGGGDEWPDAGGGSDGMWRPLGQSSALPYLVALSCAYLPACLSACHVTPAPRSCSWLILPPARPPPSCHSLALSLSVSFSLAVWLPDPGAEASCAFAGASAPVAHWHCAPCAERIPLRMQLSAICQAHCAERNKAVLAAGGPLPPSALTQTHQEGTQARVAMACWLAGMRRWQPCHGMLASGGGNQCLLTTSSQ